MQLPRPALSKLPGPAWGGQSSKLLFGGSPLPSHTPVLAQTLTHTPAKEAGGDKAPQCVAEAVPESVDDLSGPPALTRKRCVKGAVL